MLFDHILFEKSLFVYNLNIILFDIILNIRKLYCKHKQALT
jgi:hypothetical protein